VGTSVSFPTIYRAIRGKVLIWFGLSSQYGWVFWDASRRGGFGFVHLVSGLRVLLFVVLAVMFVGAGEFFEEVGVLDRGGDFVIAAGPFAEVDAATAIRAEREVFALGKDDVAAGGAAENL
jgi:hypothetical protein